MKLLKLLGLSKRRSWQELVGLRPHMIDPDTADSGYGKRRSYDVQDRIAVVDVRGMLVNDEDWWDGWGMSTYDRITEEIRGAAEDPSVDGIMLRINSPGGETDKAFETANEITRVAKDKPVWAAADTSAYSAAYLIAASASRIYVQPFTGGVGSIGVYSLHMDYSGYLEQAGIKPTFIEAGKGKTEGHPFKPLSAAAEKRIKAEVDRLYGMFVDHVSMQREMPAGKIREIGAVCLYGSDAVNTGLADKIGDTVLALHEMRVWLDSRNSASVPSTSFPAASAAHEEVPMPPEETAPEVIEPTAAETPPAPPGDDPVVAARQATARQERILSLCAIAGVSAAKAQDYIKAGKSPEDVESALLAERATESERTHIVSQLQPQTSAGAGAANPNESAIVKAAAKLAQAGKEN